MFHFLTVFHCRGTIKAKLTKIDGQIRYSQILKSLLFLRRSVLIHGIKKLTTQFNITVIKNLTIHGIKNLTING